MYFLLPEIKRFSFSIAGGSIEEFVIEVRYRRANIYFNVLMYPNDLSNAFQTFSQITYEIVKTHKGENFFLFLNFENFKKFRNRL